jgi:hypothetical protein
VLAITAIQWQCIFHRLSVMSTSPPARVLSHVHHCRMHQRRSKPTEAYPRLPTTPDNALCFIGRRGTRAGPHTVGGFRVRIPDMYIGTSLGLHYSEDITQVLHCSLEEKYLHREQRTTIRPRPKGRKCVDSLSHAITIDQSKVFLQRSCICTTAA